MLMVGQLWLLPSLLVRAFVPTSVIRKHPPQRFQVRGSCLFPTHLPSTTLALPEPAALASESHRGRMNTAWWSFYFRVSWSVNKIQAMGHVYWGHIRGKWLGGWVGAGYVTLSPCLLPSHRPVAVTHTGTLGPGGGQGQSENKALPKQQPKYISINNVCFKNGRRKRWNAFMCTYVLHPRTCLCLSFRGSKILLFA